MEVAQFIVGVSIYLAGFVLFFYLILLIGTTVNYLKAKTKYYESSASLISKQTLPQHKLN